MGREIVLHAETGRILTAFTTRVSPPGCGTPEHFGQWLSMMLTVMVTPKTMMMITFKAPVTAISTISLTADTFPSVLATHLRNATSHPNFSGKKYKKQFLRPKQTNIIV